MESNGHHNFNPTMSNPESIPKGQPNPPTPRPPTRQGRISNIAMAENGQAQQQRDAVSDYYGKVLATSGASPNDTMIL